MSEPTTETLDDKRTALTIENFDIEELEHRLELAVTAAATSCSQHD